MVVTKTKVWKPGAKQGIVVPKLAVDTIALRRRLCQENYLDFCRIFWETIIAEDPVWNWHIRIMCNELQKSAEYVFRNDPKPYDLIVNVPPGSTKSTIFSILALPWCWTRKPSIRFMGGSYDNDLSLDLANKSRRVIRSPLYKETFPEVQIRDDQDTKGYFANYNGGERRATSTGASIIGRHAHIQSVDDPINPAGARSEAEIATANEWIRETLPSRCVNQSVTPMWLIMQRLAMDDPAGERLAREGGIPVRHICLPAEISEEVRPAIFKNKYKGGLLDPVRLPKVVLEEKRYALGNFGYSGQFEQRPIPLSGGMFKIEKIKIDIPPPVSAFAKVFRWWDKACSKEKWGAFTSGVLMGILIDPKAVPRYWILDVIRERWDTATRERMMRITAENDLVTWGKIYWIGMEQEPGSSGKDSSLFSIQNLDGFRVVAETATGDKFERADPFSVQVNAGNFGMVPGAWNRPYLEEMKYFGPLCKYKDQIDASSAAHAKLVRRRVRVGSAGF